MGTTDPIQRILLYMQYLIVDMGVWRFFPSYMTWKAWRLYWMCCMLTRHGYSV